MFNYSFWMEPEWIGALGTAAGAIVGAGGIALSAYSFKRTNEDTSRPYVSVSFEAVERDDHVYFKVGNFGKTAASNIVIDFNDDLSDGEPSGGDLGAYLRKMFRSPGVTLSPGEVKLTIYQVGKGAHEAAETLAPDELSGKIAYSAPPKFSKTGEVKTPGKKYVERFSLNVAPLKNMLRVSSNSRDVEQRILKLKNELGRVANAINGLKPNRK